LDGVRDVANLAPEGEPRRVRDEDHALAPFRVRVMIRDEVRETTFRREDI
jgi:hypothetical protein